MLRILPLLQPLQTLYSWCGMTHALNSGVRATDTSIALFGQPYAGLRHDFPSNLDALCERTGYQLGEARQIALHHTLLGYFLPLVDAVRADRVLSSLKEGSIPQLNMQLGITASRIGGHHPLKACRACVAVSERETGGAFWRIDHQLPSSFVCRLHGTLLAAAWDAVTPVHRRRWLLPLGEPACTWTEHAGVTNRQFHVLDRLQSDSCAFAKLPAGRLDARRLASTYRTAMCQEGMATSRGNLKLERLVRLVRGHYYGLEHLPGMQVLMSITDEWPGLAASLSRRVPRPGHPFKHLLLITCLFESWHAFLEAYDSSQETGSKHSLPTVPDPLQVQRTEFRRLVEEQHLSVRSASAQVGISTTTGVQWARQLGLAFTARPKALTRRVEAAIQRRLGRGDPVESIASAASVSVVTVRRVLGRSSETSQRRQTCVTGKKRDVARNSFSVLCSRNPGVPLSSLRSIKGNSYAWLYRNDREWLVRQLQQFGRAPRGH
ncbi:MAG: TniQ family protein [Xanthomonadales bacterium]|nr:TniQ family protein [Xanthomonadales bacterium]